MNILASRITGGFWKDRQSLIENDTIWEQLAILKGKKEGLEPDEYSYVVDNFRMAAGELTGKYRGFVYSDSELGKWIEAAAYCLRHNRDERLEKEVDDLIDLICRAQLEDGYINTYFQVLRPESQLKHFAFSCELYNMGHLMEAAGAYFEVTGKDKFLKAMCRTADLLCKIIGPGDDQKHVYDGHAEIELGLLRLYSITKNAAYRDLAKYFVDERGKQPCFFLTEELLGDNDTGANDKWFGPDHHQSHKPVREQKEADGHAVKVTYLYSAATELINDGADKDHTLEMPVKAVWSNMCNHRMYITGAIGSQGYAERFSVDDDLPSDRSYAETCASVGICFWGKRMLGLDHSSQIADVMERAMYNGLLAGWSLDGNSYFYVNMLHCKPSVTDYREDEKHVISHRSKWFKCACCPSNILRVVENVEEYIFSAGHDTIYLDGYAQAEIDAGSEDDRISISINTEYPYSGEIKISVSSKNESEFSLALRIPGWCRQYNLSINGIPENIDRNSNGYVIIKRRWGANDEIGLSLSMNDSFVVGNRDIWDISGKAALTRGPLIYCVEDTTAGHPVEGLVYNSNNRFTPENGSGNLDGITILKGSVMVAEEKQEPYSEYSAYSDQTEITAIPYFAWGNNGKSSMDVFLPII